MVEIQWTEAEESPSWETVISAKNEKAALEALIEHINEREVIGELFRIKPKTRML